MAFNESSGFWIGEPRPMMPTSLRYDDENARAADAVRISVQTNRPVIFSGPVGSGKTTWMLEIDFWTYTRDRLSGRYNPAKSDRIQATWLDRPNWWTDVDHYCKDVKAGWSRKFDNPPAFYSADGIAEQVKRLFLDDLGAEPQTDANREEVVRLLTARHVRGLPTWITTNLSERQLRERYGERIMSRLGETIIGWATVPGADRRVPA